MEVQGENVEVVRQQKRGVETGEQSGNEHTPVPYRLLTDYSSKW